MIYATCLFLNVHYVSEHYFGSLGLWFVLFMGQLFVNQAPVVQRMDNAIHRINHYPVDKCWRKKLRYPMDSDLSGG